MGFQCTHTFLTQSTVNKISRLSEEWVQIKIFTVCCFYSMIEYADVFVERWPSVNMLGAMCGVHYVCDSQLH